MLRSLLTLRKFLFLTLVSHFLSPSTVCLFIPLVFCFTPLLFYPLLIDSFFTQLIILFSLTNGIFPVPWVTIQTMSLCLFQHLPCSLYFSKPHFTPPLPLPPLVI